MQPVISVIVALYNAEAFLPRCLASVQACPDDDMECILVNDGSTDGSRALCLAAAAGDKRLRLLDKANTGVSDSRNAGISAAQGRYIFFLDADDYINEEHWPRILETARSAESDLVSFAYTSLFPSGREQPELYTIRGDSSQSIEDAQLALLATARLNTCWGKLLRRSVIEEHGLRFDTTLVTCEDSVFMIDFCDRAHSFRLSNHCVLTYRIHAGSAMRRRPLADKLRDFAVLYDRRKRFLAAHPGPELQAALLRQSFSVLTHLMREYASGHDGRERRSAYRMLLTHPVTAEVLAELEPGALSPAYKRLEYELMRRDMLRSLSAYFRLKSRSERR